ncbi:chromosome transmission fidelity protein 18 homolog [Tubulanus polymorphus]|uniref:chromosome transmission fidelity protein 18 homolog n=1 Tax=Tubulanus polymorphus TaxID=672921 RepID=UPI003DA4B5C7
MDDEDFEAMYADDIDALLDLEEEVNAGPPSKKALRFPTPTAIDGRTGAENNNQSSEKNNSVRKNLKRKEDDMFKPLSDSEDDNDPMNRLIIDDIPDIQPKKRKKISKPDDDDDNDDGFEVTPPPSPSRTSSIHPRRERDIFDELKEKFGNAGIDEPVRHSRVFKRIPDTDFISVTNFEGSRVYMKIKDDDDLKSEAVDVLNDIRTIQLLATPYHDLLQQIQDEETRRDIDESRQIVIDLQRQAAHNEGVDMVDGTELRRHAKAETNLWVERFAPRLYTDLLSDESTNRTLLHWLKLWDHVVFGKEKKTKKAVAEQQNDGKKKKWIDKRQEQRKMEEELDEYSRPLHKVALLHGPPGLGKTTLAHIVASHAGYNVIEINASDDRTLDLFKNRLDSAVRMKAVMGGDARPNCLIIDEIDGSPQPAINHLLSVVRAVGSKAENNAVTMTKTKKKKTQILKRPIICICNDQYTPALRELRQVSLILQFPPTLATRLAGRLLDISRHVKLKTDLTTLLALCEKTDNDIRSCVNTIQFIHGRKKAITLRDVQTANVGQKDSRKSLFTLWQEIFRMPRQKRRRYINPNDRDKTMPQETVAENNTTLSSRFSHILRIVSGIGEYEKIMQGLYDNILNMRIKDTRLETVNYSNEWLCFSDRLLRIVNQSQDYTMMRYVPFTMVTFHLLFASNNNPPIQWPNSQYENYLKLTKTQNLINSLMSDISPKVRHYLNQRKVVLELLPPLMNVIHPNIRPVSAQLYSAREKTELLQLVKIMIAYNLTYRQEKGLDGQYSYILEPRVDEIIKFPGLKQRKQMTYNSKQLIAREIDLEKMRRSEGTNPQQASEPKHRNINPTSRNGLETKKNADFVPNHKKILQPVALKKQDEEKVSKDFFGRTVSKVKQPTTTSGTGNAVIRKTKQVEDDALSKDIWFHFKEGYSNAVRRNVKIQDLL